jgi:hypothetical protein
MLNKKELKQLEELLAREDIKAKKWLEDFIWRNTTEAKFKVGDIVKFSERSKYHYGVHPINWVGIVTEVEYYRNWGGKRVIRYTIEYQYKLRGTDEIGTSNTYQMEEDIVLNPMNRINLIDNPKNKDSDYFTI